MSDAFKGTGASNPYFTFDSFVVKGRNQFAHTSALAVAKRTVPVYNPLFIHGAVSTGKSHLMQAIAHYLVANNKDLNVICVTSEQFANAYLMAAHLNKLQKFRTRYRRVDVLLIDDVQYLAGRACLQEEFYHTFNRLFDRGKHIVLSSKLPPNEIANLDKRLITRFEMGLTVELQSPN